MPLDTDLQDVMPKKMPKPRPERAGALKTAIYAAIAIAVLGCAAWWLTRSPQEKADLRAGIAAFAEGTPLAGLLDYLGPGEPPAPPEVVNPPTAPGTLSGREVASTIAAPMDFGRQGEAAQLLEARSSESSDLDMTQAKAPLGLPGLLLPGQAEQRVVFDQEPVAPVTEDSRIKPGLIRALAQWLANQYMPGPRGGSLGASAQALNQECGARLASQAQGGRAALLRYAFHPSMISGLYRLYIDRFMDDLNDAAQKRGFDAAQNKQFHRALAGRAAIIASSIDGVLRVSDLAGKLARIDKLGQKAVDANADLTAAVFDLDGLRAGRASEQEQAAATLRVDGANARYRRAAEEHALAQAALAGEIRRFSGQNLDEDSLLFLAAWVARRYAQGGQARGAVESCVAALRDFSARCARFGEGA